MSRSCKLRLLEKSFSANNFLATSMLSLLHNFGLGFGLENEVSQQFVSGILREFVSV